jgi:hypothetical protein
MRRWIDWQIVHHENGPLSRQRQVDCHERTNRLAVCIQE